MGTLSILLTLVLASVSVAFQGGLSTRGATNWLPRQFGAKDTYVKLRPSSCGSKTFSLRMADKYCEDTTRPRRRPTRVCQVGKVPIGSSFPVAKQTMTTTVTRDVDSSVAQVLKIAKEGADLCRLTVQGRFEADACVKIREKLFEQGCDIPLVADIHFAPAVALRVAEAFEKIRINPGNFADGIKSFENKVYNSREEYDSDLPEIEKLLVPLILACKEKGRAMRIGTNHGSLSARVMSFWGDSPKGMVESAIEFANICRKHDYHNFLFSMKASNPLVMVQAYRLLSAEMYKLGWDYPLHLGVTEAGEGEDGRMKSAIGIGTLLADGLGDTVRVSLTEDPEFELVPCQKLIDMGASLLKDESKFKEIPAWKETTRDFSQFTKRRGVLPGQMEGDPVDMRGLMHRDGSVFSVVTLDDLKNPDQLYRGEIPRVSRFGAVEIDRLTPRFPAHPHPPTTQPQSTTINPSQLSAPRWSWACHSKTLRPRTPSTSQKSPPPPTRELARPLSAFRTSTLASSPLLRSSKQTHSHTLWLWFRSKRL